MNMELYFQDIKTKIIDCEVAARLLLIDKESICSQITKHGCWEPWLVYLYHHMIKEDFICADVGANIGYHTVHMAKLCKGGKVYAFEPQTDIFNILSTNILFNHLSDNVNHYRYALSNRVEKMQFNPIEECKEKDSELLNYGGRKIVEDGEGEGSINTTRFDSLKLTKLDFLKLDIEGFELNFLKGARKTISSNLPIIFFENLAWEKGRKNDKKVIKLLKRLGYKVFRSLVTEHKEDCIALYPDKHDEALTFLHTQEEFKFQEE